MEKSGGEVVWISRFIAMLAVFQIDFQKPTKLRILYQTSRESIHKRGKSGDSGCDHHSAFSQSTMCFSKSVEAISFFSKVVQRTKEKYPIGGLTWVGKFPGVPNARGRDAFFATSFLFRGSQFHLFNVQGNRIEEMDLIPRRCKW
jgi:hypothetical protein